MVLSSIQTLRFTAAMLVLFLHFGFLGSGFKGVDLFFVISGFVIYYTYHARRSSPRLKRRFFIHRLTKIYLLYWTALLATWLVHPFPLNRHALGSLFLFPQQDPVIPMSWSLTYELYFYALMGITLFYIPARWHKWLFMGAFLLTIGIRLYTIHIHSLHGTPLYFLTGPNLWEFLCGILAGYLFLRPSPTSTRYPFTTIAALLLVLYCLLPVQKANDYYHFIYGAIALLLVTTAALAEKQHPWKGPVRTAFIRLGDASYAIYLFGPIIHLLLLHVVHPFLSMTIIVFVSLLLNRYYEDKLLRLVRNLLEGKRQHGPSPETQTRFPRH